MSHVSGLFARSIAAQEKNDGKKGEKEEKARKEKKRRGEIKWCMFI